MREIILVLAALLVLAGCSDGSKNIQTSCVMNGYGSGKCSFTNVGSGSGAVCGYVLLKNEWKSLEEKSSTICSGSVPAKTTNEVSFSIPALQEICGRYDWTAYCKFGWVKN